MPTASSSADLGLVPPPPRGGPLVGLPPQQHPSPPSPLRALGVLARFRWAMLPGPVQVLGLLVGVIALSLEVLLVVGAHRLRSDPGTLTSVTSLTSAGFSAQTLVATLPLTFAAFLLTVTAAALGSGGGRETLPADQAVALPIGSSTDHLAALGWAPLTLAWVVPATALAASVSFAARHDVVAGEAVVVLWLLAVTAAAQLLAWLVESLRSTRHGPLAVRLVTAAVVLVVAVTFWQGHAHTVVRAVGGDLLAALVSAGDDGHWAVWSLGVAALAVVLLGAVRLGDRAAAAAARRAPRAQAALETRRHPLRPARTTEGALRRLDRAGVWRSVPLRRGLGLLALIPVVVAVTGRVQWGSLPLLPGFFGLGGALLFGVNALSLDAAGAWWRESLPVPPDVLLRVRTRVVLEVVLLPSVATLIVGGVRSGPPPGPTAVLAVLGCTLVVVARVLASVMRWSVTRPYAADLRRPRATPAPAGAMLLYSLRLTVHGVLYGTLFAALSAISAHWAWALPVTVGLSGLLVVPSVLSLRRTRRLWLDPVRRAAVVRTVGAV
ncbi:hypothetical protein V3N99_02385 [Dermatophilaceae bacterium Soc4.6]